MVTQFLNISLQLILFILKSWKIFFIICYNAMHGKNKIHIWKTFENRQSTGYHGQRTLGSNKSPKYPLKAKEQLCWIECHFAHNKLISQFPFHQGSPRIQALLPINKTSFVSWNNYLCAIEFPEAGFCSLQLFVLH